VKITRRGWAALIGGGLVIIAGRVVGLAELYVFGGAVVLVVAAAGAVVWQTRLVLEIARDVRPSRVPVGSSCRVEVAIRNRATRQAPVLMVTDPVGDGQRARLRLAPLRVGDTRVMRYRLPLHRRGIVTIGPLSVEATDPFDLARRRTQTASTIEVIVLPRVVALDPIPAAPGDEPDTGPHHLRTLATAQEEFSSLREYQPGDDVRKVHWPSTARLGRPIVRHYDEPWQRRTTVVLDVRRGGHDEESFERAVCAAASVLDLCTTRDELVRLVTTGGQDTGFISHDRELDAAMDLLAAVQVSGTGSLTGTLRTLIVRRVGGSLVTCTGALPDSERSVLATMGSRFGLHLAVNCASGRAAGSLDALDTPVVAFDRDDVLAPAWRAAIERWTRSMADGTVRNWA
jgi:uncharacterized protein (DUF58 family)